MSFEDLGKDIPELLIKIPVTVVFIGNHKALSSDTISSKQKEQWFTDLSHRIEQIQMKNNPHYFTDEISNSSSMFYRFQFSSYSLPSTDNNEFENILKLVMRGESSTVHPIVVNTVLQSLVDFYKIPGIVVFVICPINGKYSYCEGVENPQNLSKVSHMKNWPFDLILDTNSLWSSQISEAIKKTKKADLTFFSGWANSDDFVSRMVGNAELKNELKTKSFRNFPRCSNKWFSNGRILWFDISEIVSSVSDSAPTSSLSKAELEIANSEEAFQTLCLDSQSITQSEYCFSLKNYIAELRSFLHQQTNLSSKAMTILGKISANLINGIKEVVIPPSPTFLTGFSQNFDFSATVFDDNDDLFNETEYESILQTYLFPGVTINFRKDKSSLLEWSAIGLPVYTKSYDCFDIVYYPHKGSPSYKCIDPLHFRESLSAFDLTHDVTTMNNITSRDIISNIVFVNSTNPILLTKFSSAFALDYVSLGIMTSGYYDINPILRSNLVHMYGLTPTEKWYSLSIMSTSSSHTTLSTLSRDAAYRNCLRSILGKTREKIIRRIRNIQNLLVLAREYGTDTMNFSISAFEKQVELFSESISEVLSLAEMFEFESMKNALFALKEKQKVFSKQLKLSAQDLEDQLCAQAPGVIVQKEVTMLDKLDRFAILTFPFWMSFFFFGVVSSLIVATRRLKLS